MCNSIIHAKTSTIALFITFWEERGPGTFIACEEPQPRPGRFLTSVCIKSLCDLAGRGREVGDHFTVQALFRFGTREHSHIERFSRGAERLPKYFLDRSKLRGSHHPIAEVN